ncbi:hypothetical protein NLX83_24115 [Allokutzneria sp. A3M-2-11 16]|uniref:hypothetical protein n=1 Tax=Allokutzneria sp. A3M-2-11 16 TaxID=2962043 RepID=UPI0020B8C7F6|nr:hypothetical protein [Allokutzneria sp. A3M-2-11 16]MCP3802359.1 hypothetical protein [Allokutzneria sp. A3M-2-11 16]
MVRRIAAVLASALVLGGCASAQDKINGACSQVEDVVNAVPKFADPTHAGVTVPALEKQIEAAQTASKTFEDAGADTDFRAAWERMVKALQERVTAWKGWDNKTRPRGSDMYFMVMFAKTKTDADEAKGALTAAAAKSSLTECGDAIQWRY